MRDLKTTASVVDFRSYFKSSKGTVSVELALVVIVLAFIAMGAFDFARYGIEVTRITQAVRAGGQSAIQSPTDAGNATAIEQAIRDDAGDTKNELTIKVNPPFCSCPGGVPKTCGQTCADGGFAPMYVNVTAQSDLDIFFNFPGVPSSVQVTASSQLRVR